MPIGIAENCLAVPLGTGFLRGDVYGGTETVMRTPSREEMSR
jgi:hypothetical protein